MKADRLTYHEKYSDGSDVEFAVTYENKPYLHDEEIQGVITIEHIEEIDFPITKVDWLIECLERIRDNASNEQRESR